MSAEASSKPPPSPERQWWLRTLAVLQAPHAVFAALRNDSDEQAFARQEPVLALILLTGMSGILLTRAAGRLLDEPLADGSLDPQGPVAEAIAELWWLLLGLGVAVFVAFAVLLVVGLFRRRREAPNQLGRWIVGGGVVLPLIVLVVVFGALAIRPLLPRRRREVSGAL